MEKESGSNNTPPVFFNLSFVHVFFVKKFRSFFLFLFLLMDEREKREGGEVTASCFSFHFGL